MICTSSLANLMFVRVLASQWHIKGIIKGTHLFPIHNRSTNRMALTPKRGMRKSCSWDLPTYVNCHDYVIKWKCFPRYWPFVWGIHRSPVKSPHKGQWRGAFIFSLTCIWLNGWVNNREAVTLSRPFWRHCNVSFIYWPPHSHHYAYRWPSPCRR